MQIFSSTQRVTPAANVLIRELGGESVVLDLNSQTYFGLDEIGTRMWSALVTTPSLASAVEALLAEYDVERDRLEYDLTHFIQRLIEAQLISISGK